jgi:hypothetical protein
MLSVSEASAEILPFAQNDKVECSADRNPLVMLSVSEASLQILRFAQNDRVECSAERQRSISPFVMLNEGKHLRFFASPCPSLRSGAGFGSE